MSQRRMFSPDVVESEEFLDMPTSSQALYFHLGMRADDDGFVQPKITMRTIGSADDDLKVLVAKRFLLPFKNGVVVIKHWLIHNMIRGDRYKPTRFQDEKKTLEIKGNKAYTELATIRQPNGNQMAPQVRLGKVRKNTIPATTSPEQIVSVFEVFQEINPGIVYGNKTERAAADWLIKKYGQEKAVGMAKAAVAIHGKKYAPTITTPYQLKLKIGELAGFYKKQKDAPTVGFIE